MTKVAKPDATLAPEPDDGIFKMVSATTAACIAFEHAEAAIDMVNRVDGAIPEDEMAELDDIWHDAIYDVTLARPATIEELVAKCEVAARAMWEFVECSGADGDEVDLALSALADVLRMLRPA